MNIKKWTLFFAMLIFMVSIATAMQSEEDFFTQVPPAVQTFLQKSQPLTEKKLKALVVNNTMLGHTCHSHSVYELFFAKDGTVVFRKSRDNSQVYIGKWWITGNHIFSQWKTYAKKPSINELEYYHIMSNIYVPYNVNDACGRAGTFGVPFMVLKGDSFDLKKWL
ncbi:MAG: hypothetical protein JSS53_05875 [Proteobacteria bacterium]|nr:hypothetical protein [Pseudomonadota bacterium]